jgi:hypothetical protein
MSNVIAELFVNIGVTGESGTEKALKNTKNSLGEVYSSSLATKAAIFGVIYGLERMMSASAQLGTTLETMSDISGSSTKDIQEIGWAAQQAGLNAKEAEMAFVGLAQKLQQIDFGGTAGVQGLGLLQQALNTNGIDFSVEKARTNQKYLVESIEQGYKLMNLTQRNTMLGDFGLTGQTKAIAEGAFNAKNYSSAPVQSDAQLKRLSHLNTEMMNFESHVQKIIADLSSEHGSQLIHFLDSVATSLGKIVESLDKMAEKMGVFGGIADTLGGGAKYAEGVANADPKKMAEGFLRWSPQGIISHLLGEGVHGFFDTKGINDRTLKTQDVLGSRYDRVMGGGGGKTLNAKTTNHNTFNIEKADDPEAVAKHVQKMLNETASQDPTLTWAN